MEHFMSEPQKRWEFVPGDEIVNQRDKGTTVEIGGVPYLVEYDYHRAEAPIYDPDCLVCGPGCEASIDLTAVTLAGHDLTEQISDWVAEQIKERLFEILEE